MNNKGSLIGHKALGNFEVKSDSDNSAWLTHNPIESKDLPLPFQYGGDIAANVILAASTRLPKDSSLQPMSLHVEYVNPGDVNKVRNYHVDRLRLSERFMHTMVTIKQDDQPVAIGQVTYHSNEHTENSLSHVPTFPEDVPMPGDLLDDHVVLKQYEMRNDGTDLREAKFMVYLAHGLGLIARPTDADLYFRLRKEPTSRFHFWVRYQDSEVSKVFSDLESTTWSAALLAYASDYRILSSSLRMAPGYVVGRMSTMSHSLWFSPYPECRMNSPTEWLLYDTKTIMMGNNTVLCEGNIWNERKQLLVSSKQQGLVRPKVSGK